MARIYKEQVQDKMQLRAPDTSAMEYFDKERRGFEDDLSNIADSIDQTQLAQIQMQEDSDMGLLQKQLRQIRANALTMNPADSEAYTKEVKKLSKISKDKNLKATLNQKYIVQADKKLNKKEKKVLSK